MEAWPGVSAQYRSEIRALTNSFSGLWQRDAYMLPYISFTDLGRTYYLLHFQQSRILQIPDITP